MVPEPVDILIVTALRVAGAQATHGQAAPQPTKTGLQTSLEAFTLLEPGRTRTYGPRIKSPLLYQLSYEPKRSKVSTPTGFEPVSPA